MRSNSKTYDIKKRITCTTRLCDKLLKLVGKDDAIQIEGAFYNVVDKSRIAGTMAIEFYLKKSKQTEAN